MVVVLNLNDFFTIYFRSARPHTPQNKATPTNLEREFRRGTFVDFRYYETNAESNRLSESRPNTALKLKTFLMLLGEMNGINRVGNVVAKTDQTY